jgi:hypothetical protein
MATEPGGDANGLLMTARWVSVASPWLAAAGAVAVAWGASAFAVPGNIDDASWTGRMWLIVAIVPVAAVLGARSLTRYTKLQIAVRAVATLPLLAVVAFGAVWVVVPIAALLSHLTLALQGKQQVRVS